MRHVGVSAALSWGAAITSSSSSASPGAAALREAREFGAPSKLVKHVRAGKYAKSRSGTAHRLTYEMANEPEMIGQRKSFLALNSSNLLYGKNKHSTAWQDAFIRKFMYGTWLDIFCTELIIKRQLNIINISGIINRYYPPQKIYFLIGYSEELLSNFLKQLVRIDLSSVEFDSDVVYKVQ